MLLLVLLSLDLKSNSDLLNLVWKEILGVNKGSQVSENHVNLTIYMGPLLILILKLIREQKGTFNPLATTIKRWL